MAVEGRLSSEGVLEWEVSESELVGMEERLEEEGNWLFMFPVSSLIWTHTHTELGRGVNAAQHWRDHSRVSVRIIFS